jgi:hypothetical protein
MFRKNKTELPEDLSNYIFTFFSSKQLKIYSRVSHSWETLSSRVISELKLTGYEELKPSQFTPYLINSVKDPHNIILEAVKRVEKEQKEPSIPTIRILISCLKNKESLIGKNRIFNFKIDHIKMKIHFIKELISKILPWPSSAAFLGHFKDMIEHLKTIDPNKIEYTPEWDSTIIKKFILTHLTHHGFLKDTVDALTQCYFTMPYSIDFREPSYYKDHPYYEREYLTCLENYDSFLKCSVIESCSELNAMNKIIINIKKDRVLSAVPEISDAIQDFRFLVLNLADQFKQNHIFPPDNLTLTGEDYILYQSIEDILSQRNLLEKEDANSRQLGFRG